MKISLHQKRKDFEIEQIKQKEAEDNTNKIKRK